LFKERTKKYPQKSFSRPAAEDMTRKGKALKKGTEKKKQSK